MGKTEDFQHKINEKLSNYNTPIDFNKIQGHYLELIDYDLFLFLIQQLMDFKTDDYIKIRTIMDASKISIQRANERVIEESKW